MSRIAILCSGQGLQGTAMFDLVAGAPAAGPVFDAAASHLDGRDPRDLVKTADAAALHANRTGQILCCTQALAAWAAIQDAMQAAIPRGRVVAGYSVGELAAWGIAGLLDTDALLGLAARRAEAMDAATDAPSRLGAIRGLRRGEIDAICAENDVHVAIVIAPDRVLVGGHADAVRAALDMATRQGAGRTSLLDVAVASHTPLLAKAADAFAEALAAAPMAERVPAGVRLVSGIDGAPVFAVPDGRDKLARQIRQTVNWQVCLEGLRGQDVTLALELGPGDALTRMMREACPDIAAHAVSDFSSIDGLRAWLARRLG